MNTLKTTELYISNGWFVQNVNCISIKLSFFFRPLYTQCVDLNSQLQDQESKASLTEPARFLLFKKVKLFLKRPESEPFENALWIKNLTSSGHRQKVKRGIQERQVVNMQNSYKKNKNRDTTINISKLFPGADTWNYDISRTLTTSVKNNYYLQTEKKNESLIWRFHLKVKLAHLHLKLKNKRGLVSNSFNLF